MTDSSTSFDTNGDGITDVVGEDTNGDGVIDEYVVDSNEDGVVDGLGIDADENGVIDETAVDQNEDGTVEGVDLDTDQDGVVDQQVIDSDENGVPDSQQDQSVVDVTPQPDDPGSITVDPGSSSDAFTNLPETDPSAFDDPAFVAEYERIEDTEAHMVDIWAAPDDVGFVDLD